MTTGSEIFDDISTSRTILGSGMMIAIRMTMIAMGIATCDFIAPPVVQPQCHTAKIAYCVRLRTCKRMQALRQLPYKAPWESPVRNQCCDTKREQEAHFRRWGCHVPDPVLRSFVRASGVPSPRNAGLPSCPDGIRAQRHSGSGS